MGTDTDLYRKVWWKNVELWFYSILSTFIGGGASAAAVMIIDPAKFNIHEGLANVGKVFLVAGIINVLPLLKQSPLPALPKLPDSDKPNS